MAVTVEAGDIADLVSGTLRDLGRMRFQQIAQDLQDYEVMSKWLKKDKITIDSGRGIQRNLMTKTQGAARHVGLTDTDSGSIPDLMEQLNIPWRHAQTKWVFERRETLMNRGKSLIFNIIVPRRTGAMIDLAKELEAKAWQSPASSTDKLLPYGLPYYVVYNATTGFNGGAASGHTTVAGIDIDANPTYKNYTAQYTNVTKADLIKKLRVACRKIGWKTPVRSHDYSGNAGRNLRLYTDNDTIESLTDVGEGQNENLGRDLAPYGMAKDVAGGELLFRGFPIVWVPYLDDSAFTAATAPVYLIDHSTFFPVVLEGDYLVESKPIMAPNQHNMHRVFVDLSYNYLCVDRRRNALIATA